MANFFFKFILLGICFHISVTFAGDFLRDPSTPLATGGAQNSGVHSKIINLQAIIFDQRKPRAIIDGKTCFQGEKCGAFVLTAVKRQSVILYNDDSEQMIEIPLYSSGTDK